MVLNPQIPLCAELPTQDGPSVLTICLLMGFLQQLHYRMFMGFTSSFPPICLYILAGQ